MKRILVFTIAALIIQISSAQVAPFGIALESIDVPGVGGLQSYALGQHEGKWLVIGGRLDGLHRRQPWASFDLAGHNDQIWIIDPVGMQSWYSELAELSVDLREQLSSTNMEFYQVGDRLYLIGGYGYSSAAGDHATFPYLTAVDIPEVMNAIINDGSLVAHFRQIEDEQFAVTGGYLERIDEVFHLVGGQRFDGRYNPMNMPTFTQQYVDGIRKFTLADDGVNITITHQDGFNDAVNLHRRDFNVLPQIMTDGSEGLTAFSGVFQQDADIPFLNCVNITAEAYSVQPDFSQYYNHYHCASVPIYSEATGEMHNLFFGGIAQYYEENGELIMDDEVPFVKTIARVTRHSDGSMSEFKLPIELPTYLGSGAEFIPVQDLSLYANGVIDLDAITEPNTLIGYIYGGIESSDKNIFWLNDGTQSSASSGIFEVYLSPSSATALDELNVQSTSAMRMQLYPNEQVGILYIDLMLNVATDVYVRLCDETGRVLDETRFKKSKLSKGMNHLEFDTDSMASNQLFIVQLSSEFGQISQKMLINE